MKYLLAILLLISVNVVKDYTPTSGPKGTLVTIHVSSLQRSTNVIFGEMTANKIVIDVEKGVITCKAPENYGKLGKVDIIIISPNYPRTVIKDGFEYK